MGTSASAVLNKKPANRIDRRKHRKPRKLDEKKVLELREQGLAVTDIAAHQGVVPSTIWRFLDKTSAAHQELETFKANRANVFADLQNKAMKLQHAVIDSFYVDGVLVPLTAQQKTSLMLSLNAVSGTIYDKERLETGKSTQNHSLIARMMGDALDSAHHSPTSSETGKADAQAESRT